MLKSFLFLLVFPCIDPYPHEHTYYDELGLDVHASQSDIRKAYLRMARHRHPDRNTNTDAQQAFKRLGHAYYILSDQERRHQYDAQRKSAWLTLDCYACSRELTDYCAPS